MKNWSEIRELTAHTRQCLWILYVRQQHCLQSALFFKLSVTVLPSNERTRHLMWRNLGKS